MYIYRVYLSRSLAGRWLPSPTHNREPYDTLRLHQLWRRRCRAEEDRCQKASPVFPLPLPRSPKIVPIISPLRFARHCSRRGWRGAARPPVSAAASSSTAAFAALPQLCGTYAASAQVKARVRLRVRSVGLRDGLMRRERNLALLFRRCGRSRCKRANAAVGRFPPAVRGILLLLMRWLSIFNTPPPQA